MRPTLRNQRPVAAIFLWLSLLPPYASAQTDRLTGAEALHPDALVDAVLERNPSLPAAESAARAARSRIVRAGALEDPMLSTTAAPKTLGHSDMDPGVGIELSQRLPWPGKRGLSEQIARLEARAVEHSIPSTLLDLTQLAKEAFADWYLVHAGLRVNAANRKLWEEIREITQAHYASGTGGKQDVLQADLEYQMLDHGRVVLERQRAEVRARLNRLLNRGSGADLPPPAPIGEPSPPPPLAELRARALAHRSEIQAAEAALGADSTRVDLAQREFLPDFQVSTGYNSMWGDADMRWSVGVGIDIPLYRGKRRADVSAARAEESESRWRLQGLSLEIAEAVEQAHARVREARHLLGLHDEQLLPLARANLEAARTAYRARTGTLESLLRAERSFFDTRLNHEAARADYYRSMAALERAVGGWNPPPADVR